MNTRGLKIVAVAVLFIASGYSLFELARPGNEVILGDKERESAISGDLSAEERIERAMARSDNVKGVYMTAAVANDQGRPATALRERVVSLIDRTELDAVVIDVKETKGSEITPNLEPFLEDLRRKNIWTIARIATFRDGSQIKMHPEYYLKRPDGAIWRDNKGNAWIDPMSPGGRQYLLAFSKEVTDLGFDELQYDYIRFPSDGDTKNIVYPAYQPSAMAKYDALKDFFLFLNRELKSYKPDLILSADLFGQIAIEDHDLGIGQRLVDVGSSFEYISLMLYPSHFYSGFYLPADPVRGLDAISLPYRAKAAFETVSAKPYDVIYRALLRAEDTLASTLFSATSTASTTVEASPSARAKLRPWLQDFDLTADTARGIYYDVKAVRAQIDAAEKAGASGWLLWSPTNTYTEAALRHE